MREKDRELARRRRRRKKARKLKTKEVHKQVEQTSAGKKTIKRKKPTEDKSAESKEEPG